MDLHALDEIELADHIDNHDDSFLVLDTVETLNYVWRLLQGNDKAHYVYETGPHDCLAWRYQTTEAAIDALASSVFTLAKAMGEADGVKALWRGNRQESPSAYAAIVELDDERSTATDDRTHLIVQRTPDGDFASYSEEDGEHAALEEFNHFVRHALESLAGGDVHDQIASAGGHESIALSYRKLATLEESAAGEALRSASFENQFGRGGDRVTMTEAADLVGVSRQSLYRVVGSESWL